MVQGQDLGAWLDSVGLSDCAPLLAAQHIDAELLRELSEADLQEIGLTLGQRRRLLRALASLERDSEAPPAGEAAAGRAERKQMTAVFCDLVGSTALSMRLDPEELHEVLRRHLDTIAGTMIRFGGYVAQYMGDGLMVYFGWPQAREDAAEQAVRASLAAVEAARAAAAGQIRMQVRVGAATGLIVVGGNAAGAPEHGLGNATTNLAARLQSVAAPDEVVIAASTRRLVGDLFELDQVGPFDLKGIDEPVLAWRVAGERDIDSRFQALRSGVHGGIVGRTAELQLLEEAWASARGGSGRLVLLRGEAGIGKTHIVESFVAAQRGRAHVRLACQCLPNHGSTALLPIVAALRRLAGVAAEEPAEAVEGKLGELMTLAGLEDPRERAMVAEVLSFRGRDPAPAAGDAKARKARLLAALADLVAGLAAQQPMLLQLEDLHWSDPTSLELCALLSGRAAGLPLLLLATARPEFVPGWEAGEHVHHLTIAGLGTAESAELARRIAGDTLPAEVAEQILGKTDGMPLYIEELTKELLESGALSATDGNWTLASGAAALSVPATLQDSLAARLDRLGWVKEVAQTASVIGRNFAPALLERVLPLPPERIAAGLRILTDAQIIAATGSPAAPSYGFRHALFQDAAYSSLLLSERRTLHAAIARVLERDMPEVAARMPETVAHHHSEARQPEPATHWWRQAGRRNVAATAYAESIQQFGRALEQLEQLPGSPERDRLETRIRMDMHTPLLGIEGYTGESVRANIDRSIRLYETTGAGESLFAIGTQMQLAYSSSHMVRAVALGEQLHAAAEVNGKRGHRFYSRWMLGMALSGRGRLEDALAMLDSGLALADPAADAALADNQSVNPMVAALSYKALVLYQLGRFREAEAADAASLSEARAGRHSPTIGFALTLAICVRLLQADHVALAATANQLVEHAKRQESRPLQTVAAVILGLLRAEQRFDEEEYARSYQMILSLRRGGWDLIVGWLTLLYAHVGIGHHRLDLADAALAGLAAVVEPRGHDSFVPELYRLRAAIARGGGDAARAEAHLRHALGTARGQRARLAELRAATDLARLLADRDQGPEPEALLEAALADFAAEERHGEVAAARALRDAVRLALAGQ